MTNVDIVGCRRRSAYDFQEQLGKKMDFRCKGREGPPCFLKLGDIGDFRATFHTGRDKWRLHVYCYNHIIKRIRIRNIVDKYLFLLLDFPIRRFRQDAKATVFGLSVDWYGLDIEGCKYLEGGCKGNAGDVVSFSYPIKVLPYYPPVCT